MNIKMKEKEMPNKDVATYTYKATIKIKECIANDLQYKLDCVKVHYTKEGVEAVFSTKFENGMEADIKVCSSEAGYYVDPIMYDSKGNWACLFEVGTTLLGDYVFTVNQETYLVELRV